MRTEENYSHKQQKDSFIKNFYFFLCYMSPVLCAQLSPSCPWLYIVIYVSCDQPGLFLNLAPIAANSN